MISWSDHHCCMSTSQVAPARVCSSGHCVLRWWQRRCTHRFSAGADGPCTLRSNFVFFFCPCASSRRVRLQEHASMSSM
ncbi:hypothetical protein IF1G_09810 [Cordyceps javanica]|uniref:Uncharacterized protein n=1 Tax=Cordyceps javanica TaxID=43265 RepID=A0A545UQK3_9HYPO|nr:hypothetical protein IF1G_09810 [Cordyceps javanica]